jgi:hypothetical protein
MKYAKWMPTMMLVLLSGVAVAQLTSEQKLVTHVPFEFTVANKIVPAGDCVIQSGSQNARTLMIRNVGAHVGLFATASPSEAKNPARTYALVFNHYGNQYFLSGIKLEGAKTMYSLPESKAEAELRAQNVPHAEEVLLASLK